MRSQRNDRRPPRTAPPRPREGGRLTLSAAERSAAAEQAERRRQARGEAFRPKDSSPQRTVFSSKGIDFGAIPGRVAELSRALMVQFSVSREGVIRALIIAALMIFFALTQTTLFTRLPPFGAVPDLMLSFSVAVAVTEGEHRGAVTALCSALVITALGSVSFDPAPILYLVCAYTAGVLCRYVFKQNALIRAIITVAACLLRALATLAALAVAAPTFTFAAAMRLALVPEFFATLVCAPFVHLAVWAALLVFHRSRAQRTGDS